MQITFACYATIRDAIGQKSLHREVTKGTTVGDALTTLADEFDDLGPLLFDSSGELRANVNVLVNDENVRTLDGPATVLSDGDTVGIAPGVAGGSASNVHGKARGAWA
ncbi:ubiquitin-like small modifier protein 1 [Halorientalis brevis]|uniref:Ubiquitin-like small modifier protein 1 n=1 Tax=Halorientalis brevis TaxID=1126241 RepID=A0ABD6CEH1_9EURY|nr:ubiquitin-like small modifier protein 1 [Halorientalis brevis]